MNKEEEDPGWRKNFGGKPGAPGPRPQVSRKAAAATAHHRPWSGHDPKVVAYSKSSSGYPQALLAFSVAPGGYCFALEEGYSALGDGHSVLASSPAFAGLPTMLHEYWWVRYRSMLVAGFDCVGIFRVFGNFSTNSS
ncbi:uncharacterized protein G2W53_018480 [Senna tora]|uniref:Uncharacterized protein n=1 Tax=Senna tora TaxID=362788 RepID=A0A834WPW2_9FABA|nr:uncharacterized protein G2W53_018480 [Senna tora]